MNAKITLLAISILAVGLFAMPSTLSLLSGQHTFYGGNAYTGDNAVKCSTCHNNINTELTANAGPHGGLTNCKGCHTDGSVSVSTTKGALVNGKYGGKGTTNHAAAINQCTACHTAVPAQFGVVTEAHRPMYTAASTTASGIAGMVSKDEACIACHTAAGAMVGTSLTASSAKLKVSVSGTDTYTVKYKIEAP